MKVKFLLLLLIGITGCDIPGVLEVKNELSEEIEITYSNQGQEKIESRNTGMILPSDKGTISLGFGTRWTEKFIEDYPKLILDTITLKVGEIEYYCSSEKCKTELVNKANRKSKRRMSITINSDLIKNSFERK